MSPKNFSACIVYDHVRSRSSRKQPSFHALLDIHEIIYSSETRLASQEGNFCKTLERSSRVSGLKTCRPRCVMDCVRNEAMLSMANAKWQIPFLCRVVTVKLSVLRRKNTFRSHKYVSGRIHSAIKRGVSPRCVVSLIELSSRGNSSRRI